MKKAFKDIFHQSADAEARIPEHWVVQYYVEGDGFPRAEYFATEDEAIAFGKQLIAESKAAE